MTVREVLPVHEPYRQAEQQHTADQLGMWLFLASEGMLFGAVFLSLAVYRLVHPAAMHAASAHVDMWVGGINTAVLLTSSLTMALSVKAAREGRRGEALAELGATAVLGLTFEGIKLYSWFTEYAEGLFPGHGPPFPIHEFGARMFFHLYFVSTGLHALHLAVAICLVSGLIVGVLSRRLPLPERSVTVEIVGLYWHLVDVVWVFLYPVLYLISR